MRRRRFLIPLLCLCTAWFTATAAVEHAGRAMGAGVTTSGATGAGAASGGCGCCEPSADGAACAMVCCADKPAAPAADDSSGKPTDDKPAKDGKCGGNCDCRRAVAAADVSPIDPPAFVAVLRPAASVKPERHDSHPVTTLPATHHARGPPVCS